MKSGYHQIVIEERQKEMTSFTVGPLGFNEVLPSKCPCNLPEVARAVTCIIKYATLIFLLMISYVFSKTFVEHVHRLKQVYDRTKNYGMTLLPKKCFFIVRERSSILGILCHQKGYRANLIKFKSQELAHTDKP